MFARRYNRSCLCGYSHSCVADMHMATDQSSQVKWPIPGLYVGCDVLEVSHRSRLVCFYNETCLNTLRTYLRSPAAIDVAALDVSKLIHFTTETSIAETLDRLMVEAWDHSMTYENYYAVCQPTECLYTIVTKHDLVYIVTTIIGLIGGLVTTLKLGIRRLVSCIPNRFDRRQMLVRYGVIFSRTDRSISSSSR